MISLEFNTSNPVFIKIIHGNKEILYSKDLTKTLKKNKGPGNERIFMKVKPLKLIVEEIARGKLFSYGGS